MTLKTLNLILALAAPCLAQALPGQPKLPYCPPAVVEAEGLKGKFLFGYQGWFGYPGDGSKNNAWFHWYGTRGEQRRMMVDMLPDVSEYGADELTDGELKHRDGKPVQLYSAHNPKTVDRHFKWMKDYGLHGVFLQRFSAEMAGSPVIKEFRDNVTRHVMDACEKHGRVFALMYDVSGDKNVVENLKADWLHLSKDLSMDKSRRHLRLKGRPVVAIWGLGFNHNPNTPAQAAELVAWYKSQGVAVFGGVPTGWRTLTGDSQPDPAWGAIYRSFDVVSPWSVNRYQDPRGADRFRRRYLEGDIAEAKKAGVDYMPVVFPGYSAHNLSWDAQPLNEVRRMGGVFFWHQIVNAVEAGASMLYGAMFDEVDEGTAFYKVVPDTSGLPTAFPFVAHDSDGYVLPSDWYLRLAGLATMAVEAKFKPTLQMPLDIHRTGAAEGCFACPGEVHRGDGSVISLNFIGGGPAPMAWTEVAGAVPAAFWNNAEFEIGTLKGLADNAGRKTGAQVSYGASGTWRQPIVESQGGARMMKGYIDAVENSTMTVKVTGLPAAFAKRGYKLIIYCDGDDAEATRSALYTVAGRSIEAVDAPKAYFDGRYAESLDGKPGNSIVFSGLKSRDFTLQATPAKSTGKWLRAPLNGLQIVAE